VSSDLEAIHRFAARAREFRSWAEGEPAHEPVDEVRLVLDLLVNLYSAALALPEGEPPDDEVTATTHEEWLRIYQRCASLPVDMYGEVVATIGDDIADIHRDLMRGFQRYEQSRFDHAAWEWAFHFRVHWGHHATAALNALHAWWADHSG
jgi:hypothetical protein